MLTLIHARRTIAFFCIAIALVALLPGASSLPWAILTPFWLFVAAVITLYVYGPFSGKDGPPTPVLSVISNRAPPIA
ncbi:MAG TPA: hypothetical protein VK335_13195 [Bryobacteraceae bacterium]|nr:hypothetical protein [Bryobacteraceae bacterium]